MVEMVWWSRTRERHIELEGGKPRCAHREHPVLYLWPSAMISTAFCFAEYERVLRASNDIDRPETEEAKLRETRTKKEREGASEQAKKKDREREEERQKRRSQFLSRLCFITFYRIFIFLYYFSLFLLLPELDDTPDRAE